MPLKSAIYFRKNAKQIAPEVAGGGVTLSPLALKQPAPFQGLYRISLAQIFQEHLGDVLVVMRLV